MYFLYLLSILKTPKHIKMMEYSIGEKVNVRINKIQDNGCYCSFLPLWQNQYGFMPKHLMPSYLDNQGDFTISKGDNITVVINNITDRGIILSDIQTYDKEQKRIQKKEEKARMQALVADFAQRYERGTVFEAEVVKVQHSKVMVKVANYSGVIRKEDTNWNEIEQLSDLLFEGETISAVYLDHDTDNLYFSLKHLNKKPYDDALYDLSLVDLLKFAGHNSMEFIGQAKLYPYGIFIENLYSSSEDQNGKLLIDPIYGYNLRAIVNETNIEVQENKFYRITLKLLSKQKRKERNQLFQFSTIDVVETDNPYKADVKLAFQRNTTNPASNQRDARLLDEIGKNMYSSKDRMFFELVQNADDAAAQRGVYINVKTEGDYLIVKHNGYSFDREDFVSITTAANGTKKANENKTGYKGIGFKSVFTDSEQVYISTGGYQFKFDKKDPIFQDFDRFYLENHPMIRTEEDKRIFLDMYRDSRMQFDGIRSIPWQLEPIWSDTFPCDLGEDFTSSNVAIALKIGTNKIQGPNGYCAAIEDIIRNPKFMLFLRNTKRIDFNGKSVSKNVKDGVIIIKNSFNADKVECFKREDFEAKISNDIFENSGIDLRITVDKSDEGTGKILEAKFVDLDDQEFENIPKKIAINSSTSISFAVPLDDNGSVMPKLHREEISMFAFLPTLVKDFKFPFFVNANFILDPPRQRILGDNPWNFYLMQEIAKCIVRWSASLNLKKDKNALNVLVSEYFAEDIADTKQLAQHFNISYKNALESESFVLNHKGGLSKLDEIALDLPGFSNFVGPDIFCQIMGTDRCLPSHSIDSSILKKKIFNSVKSYGIGDILNAITNSQLFNQWYISTTDAQRLKFGAWIKWIDEKDGGKILQPGCLQKLVSYLPLLQYSSVNKSFNDIEGSECIVSTRHILPIKDILVKLGFKCSDNAINSSHPLYKFIKIQDEESIWLKIKERDFSVLSLEERIALFKALEDFDGVGEAKLKEIALFKNRNGEYRTLGSMAVSNSISPAWLNNFLISEEEYSELLNKYLIKENKIFEDVIQGNYDAFTNVSIPDLYETFKDFWTPTFTKNLINKNGATIELLSIVEKTDGAKHYFIERFGQISFNASSTKESIEYRVIRLALLSAFNIEKLKGLIYIDNKNLSQYTISDDVLICISGKEYHFSLSQILPNQFNNSTFNLVKELISDLEGNENLFSLSRMSNSVIKERLSAIRATRTPEQYAFYICYNLAYVSYGQRVTIPISDEQFVSNVLSYFFEHKIDVLDKYINLFPNQKIVGKFINCDDVTVGTERLSSIVRQWANSEDKEKFLIQLGVKGPLSDEMKRRYSFLKNESISLSTNTAEITAFLDWAITLETPFTGENQVKVLKEIFTRLQLVTKYEIEDYQQACEWVNDRYEKFVRNKIHINLIEGEMPKRGVYKQIHLYTETVGDYAYFIPNVLYINAKNKRIETTLLTVCDDAKVPFTKNDWTQLFMVSVDELNEKDDEIAQKNKKIESLSESIQEKDEIIRRYRAKFGELELAGNSRENEYDTIEDIHRHAQSELSVQSGQIIERDGLSKEQQKDAHIEAEEVVRRKLESYGYICDNWRRYDAGDDNLFQPWRSVNQINDIISPNGEKINLVIKSAKGGYIYLSATDFEFLTSNSKNVLMVWDGKDVHSVTADDIFNSDSNVNLIFDTEYTPKHYYAALSKVFQYVKRTTFAVKNPKYNAFDTIKSFGMDSKTEGVQELFDDNDL